MGTGRSSRNEGEETNLCYLANDGMAIYSPAVGESWEWQQEEEQGSWSVKLEAHPFSKAEKAGDWVGNTAFDLFNSQRKRHVRSRQARNCQNAVIVPDFKLLSHHLCVAVHNEMLSHLRATMIEYQVWSWRNEHHLYFQRKKSEDDDDDDDVIYLGISLLFFSSGKENLDHPWLVNGKRKIGNIS